ncbi:MAG: DUF2064 domain-containing protein [Synechococcales cyanobacterium RM1_1_8]|nr:DUF2064 domain-containing protein [Synechococcales cyanobacterium RM1_1_8]
MNDHLIVFSRYPEPGRTKTRLIPTLGAVGAARLQRQMTEHSLATVAQLQRQRPVQVWICYAGAEAEAFRAWLGEAWDYWPQAEGDLGDRLAQAFQAAFLAGAQRVVAIGIDCPALSPALLGEAFDQLKAQDLVLGPALDGGYYLIGLKGLWPSLSTRLFRNMAWGTAGVRAETLARAELEKLAVAQLTLLGDVDYGSDLPLWIERQRPAARNPAQPPLDPLPDPQPKSQSKSQLRPALSIILPVLNEAAALASNLPILLDQIDPLAFWADPSHNSQPIPVEVIVVDGGSGDQTVLIAQALRGQGAPRAGRNSQAC